MKNHLAAEKLWRVRAAGAPGPIFHLVLVLALLLQTLPAGAQRVKDDRPVRPGVADRLGGPQLALADVPIDKTLKEIIASHTPERYRIYGFREVGRMEGVTLRRWEGLLLMPNVTTADRLIPVRFSIGARRFEDWWYRDPAKTRLTKLISDGSGRIVGIASLLGDGGLTATLDLDGDRKVDLMHGLRPTVRGVEEFLIVSEARGLAFLDDLLRGTDALCNRRGVSGGAGVGGDSASPFAAADRRAVVPGCYRRSADEGGAVVGGAGVGGDRRQDPADRLCAGRGAGRPEVGGLRAEDPVTAVTEWWAETITNGFDGERDGAGVQVVRILAATFSTALPVSILGAVALDKIMHFPLSVPQLNRREATARDRRSPAGESDEKGESGRDGEGKGSGSSGGSKGGGSKGGGSGSGSGGARSQPGPGPGGDPSEASAATALNQLCARRTKARRRDRWFGSVTEMDQRAADTECDDPVVNPAAAQDGSGAKKMKDPCKDDRAAGRNRKLDLQGLLASAGSGCGPTERPGPDGRCGGGRRPWSLKNNGGNIGIAYGGVIGHEPCDPRVCNPEQR